jgi:hypothetical protein
MTYLYELAGLVVFVIAFVLFGRFVLRLLARWGKWSDLARTYGAESQFSGPTKSLQSGSFGPSVHKGTLVLGADASALHVSVLPIFSYAHPPLRIPWQDIKVHKRNGLFGDELVLTIRNHPSIEIYALPSMADLLNTWSKGAFQLPAADDHL